MNKSSNIIKFYEFTNILKNKIRTGWIEVDIKKERLESVAEHIYGCLMFAIAIDSEYDLNIDMYKVLKMLSLHELEEILMGDLTLRADITKEEKILLGKIYVKEITNGLFKQNEIEELLNEFNAHITKESIFCYHIDKIECDMQAKMYDLEGVFLIEKAKEDLPFFGDRASEIEKISKTASDYWINYDKPRYEGDEIFKDLINEIQSKKELSNGKNI